jgi:hypothetical protein
MLASYCQTHKLSISLSKIISLNINYLVFKNNDNLLCIMVNFQISTLRAIKLYYIGKIAYNLFFS